MDLNPKWSLSFKTCPKYRSPGYSGRHGSWMHCSSLGSRQMCAQFSPTVPSRSFSGEQRDSVPFPPKAEHPFYNTLIQGFSLCQALSYCLERNQLGLWDGVPAVLGKNGLFREAGCVSSPNVSLLERPFCCLL